MRIWAQRNKPQTRKALILNAILLPNQLFWRALSRLLKRNLTDNFALRKQVIVSLILTLIASTLVGIFISAPTSKAVVVRDCSSIGQLRNGGFEAPVPGTTVISDANATYPQSSVTAAQQDSNNSVTNAVWGSVGGSSWNHLDASADGSTYRTYRLSGRAGDARVYWNTTEASEQIEYGSFVTPHAGSNFAELNATVKAALFQDIPTVPGVTIRWSLAHRGRDGQDTMRVYIGKPTNTVAQVRAAAARFNGSAQSNNQTLISNSETRTTNAREGLTLASARAAGSSTLQTDITDGNSNWRVWYGEYEETSTTTTNTRFLFESVSPTGGSGNLIDSVSFAPVAACPITRLFNSTTDTQTVNVFDTNSGSFAIVPDEPGHTESVTALTLVEGPGRLVLSNNGRSMTFTPNGAGVTTYDYSITYTANGISSTSDGTITITARDILGAAGCSPGSVQTSTNTSNNQTTVIATFNSPVQANTDSDDDHRSGTCTWTVPDGVFGVDYLVVGGGGGGASGGGGGGGVVTSWATANANDTATARTQNRNPLAVTPGEVINITVGGGGKPGWGGNYRAGSNQPTRVPTTGGDSRFGSVVAAGGGFGGGPSQAAGGDGGSGGGSRFDAQAVSGSATASQVVGASSFGNPGGGSTASGGFRAGGGGGGAGTSARVSSPPRDGAGGLGGLIRTIPVAGGNNEGFTQSGSTQGGGGHGGRGVASSIASFTGVFAEYGCGGGGGVNNNSNANVTDGGGLAGCASAGNGSSFGTMFTTTSATQFNGTAVPTEGFGGGGGGTDPEGNIAGSGGSGVVIIRYLVSNVACPNSSNATNVTGPIACPYPITIAAGASVATQYNLSHGDAANGFVSFPGGSTDTVTVTTTIGNGTDTVTVTINGNRASFALSNASTALAGATYPMRYTIFSGAASSTSFVLLRITDPSQATPVIIPVDPRATEVDLTAVRIGGSQMTQVCFTPIDDNSTPGYGNVPTVDRISARSTETRTVTTATGRLRLQGTSANLQEAVNFIRVTKHASDSYLIPGTTSRRIAVNVSNGTVGGNGSCNFGNESVIELRPLQINQTYRQGDVGIKQGR